jgi:hypothetical protein
MVAPRGKKHARIAVGHTILSPVSTLLSRKQAYQDLGATDFHTLDQYRVERRLVQRKGAVAKKGRFSSRNGVKENPLFLIP